MTYIKDSKFFYLATIVVEDRKSIEIIEKVAYIQNLKQKGVLWLIITQIESMSLNLILFSLQIYL